MNPLVKKIQKARESSIETSGHKFTIRRPTHFEIGQMLNNGEGLTLKNAFQFVVDWDLREIDLIPGGTDKAVPFDYDLFAQWIEDQPGVWGDLMEEIKEAYVRHLEEERGKLEA